MSENYDPLELAPRPPEFRSKIPANLRHPMACAECSVFLADALSVIDQKMDWMLCHLTRTMVTVKRDADTLDRWRRHIESPVKLGAAFLVFLGPWIVNWIFRV